MKKKKDILFWLRQRFCREKEYCPLKKYGYCCGQYCPFVRANRGKEIWVETSSIDDYVASVTVRGNGSTFRINYDGKESKQ